MCCHSLAFTPTPFPPFFPPFLRGWGVGGVGTAGRDDTHRRHAVERQCDLHTQIQHQQCSARCEDERRVDGEVAGHLSKLCIRGAGCSADG
eukprot:61908-Chlamydomonas_euryale.AAC.1